MDRFNHQLDKFAKATERKAFKTNSKDPQRQMVTKMILLCINGDFFLRTCEFLEGMYLYSIQMSIYHH